MIVGDNNLDSILYYVLLDDGTYGVKAGTLAKDVATINVPETYNGIKVTEILNEGFSSLSNLEKVILPNGIVTIRPNAFYKCSSLNSINLPNTLKSIKQNAFYGCTALKSIVIPEFTMFIGKNAFYGSGLESVEFPYTKKWEIKGFTWSTSANSGYDTTTGVITNNGTSKFVWGSTYFEWSTNISTTSGFARAFTEKIYFDGAKLNNNLSTPEDRYIRLYEGEWTRIPDVNETVQDGIFEYTLLENSTYSVKANSNARGANVIDIPDTYNGKPVTEIAESGFRDLVSLTEVTIPDSIQYVRSYAFSGCSLLAKVDISDNSKITDLGSCAFEKCINLRQINIPDGCLGLGAWCFAGCDSLRKVVISENSQLELISIECFYDCEELNSFYIPGKVYQISNSAFYGCSSLTSINIPASVTCIGSYAFYGTSLTSATFEVPTGWNALYYEFLNKPSTVEMKYFDISDSKKAAEALSVPVNLAVSYYAGSGYTYRDIRFYEKIWNRS